jgi:hypothetical protein
LAGKTAEDCCRNALGASRDGLTLARGGAQPREASNYQVGIRQLEYNLYLKTSITCHLME